MEVRVGVSAIDIPFAPRARVELPALQRLSLEIDRRLELQNSRTRIREDVGLGEVSLGEIAALNGGCRVGYQPDGGDTQPGVGLFRHMRVRLPIQRRGDSNQ